MDVKLPKLGEGADSGVVVNILVKAGDSITKGQTLLELENEKAVAPIPSPADGKVSQLRVKEGDKISVGQVLLVLDAAGSAAPAPAAAAPAAAPRSQARPARVAAPEPAEFDDEPGDEPVEESALAPAASPTIRRVARELGIDLRKIRGSEPGGRIVMADLRAYVQRLIRQSQQPRAAAPSAAPAKAPAESIDFSKWGPVKRQAMSPLRATISKRMTENWTTIPHVTQFDDADISGLLELRKKFVAAYEKKGVRLTVTSFIVKAVAETLKKHPIFNSSIDEATQEMVLKDYVHIGLAVDTEAGLMVPVIRDADKKDLVQISRDISDLADKARDRKLTLDDMRGGTFTISNQGGIGGAHFTPIINKPEVAILGLGKGALKPVVREKKIETRTLMPIGLSYDHRAIDGGSAARFTVDLLQAIESFTESAVKI